MGSILQGTKWDIEKREAFTRAFGRLKQRVIWKYENESLPNKSDNVMITPWLPQRDVLAHRNVKLFITHGGLLGLSEAITEGIPVLGIPIYSDQTMNVLKAVDDGYGILMKYNEINEDLIVSNINEIIINPKYQMNAKEISKRYNDRPMSAEQATTFWVEYLIRNKDSTHFKSAAHNLNFIQRHLIDSYSLLALIMGSVLYLLFRIKCALFGKSHQNNHVRKVKRN